MKRLPTSLPLHLFCIIICACAALFLASAPASAQTGHRSPWSAWVTVNDGHQNGIDFSIRKGDNDVIERSLVFVRFRSRYTQEAEGEVTFSLINSGTGDSVPVTEGFDLKPGQVDEAAGRWHQLPGVKDGADAWTTVQCSYRDLAMKFLMLPGAGGGMTQVYPVDNIAAQAQQAAADRAKKQAEDQAAAQQATAAAEAKRQADQQASDQQVTAKRQADQQAIASRQAADHQRIADAEQERQETSRKAEQVRQAEASRRAQAVLNQANQTLQNMANVNQVNIAATAQSQQRERDADAELARRREEIGSQSRNSVDPKISDLQSDLQEPQDALAMSQASVERQQAEVDRYKQLADADQNPATSAINRVGQALAESDLRKYQGEADEHQTKIKRIQRQIVNEQERWDREKEEALTKALADAQAESDRSRMAIASTRPDPPAPAVLDDSVRQAATAAASGISLSDQRRWPEMEAAFREAVRLQPATWTHQHNLGVALERQNKWPEAEMAFREATRLQPTEAHCHSGLGSALQQQSKWAEAQAAFREAVRLKPEDKTYQDSLAYVTQQLVPKPTALLSQKPAALTEKDLVKDMTLQMETTLDIGHALVEAKQYGKAEELLRKQLLSFAMFASGTHASNRVLDANVRFVLPRVHSLIGSLLLKQQKFTEAEIEYRAAIRINSGFPDNIVGLGAALEGQKRWQDAETVYQRAASEPRAAWYYKAALARVKRQKYPVKR